MGEDEDVVTTADSLMSGKELLEITKRLHIILRDRADAAKERHKAAPADEAVTAEYLERAKELYVYARLLDSCIRQSKRVMLLEAMVETLEKEFGIAGGLRDIGLKKGAPN